MGPNDLIMFRFRLPAGCRPVARRAASSHRSLLEVGNLPPGTLEHLLLIALPVGLLHEIWISTRIEDGV